MHPDPEEPDWTAVPVIVSVVPSRTGLGLRLIDETLQIFNGTAHACGAPAAPHITAKKRAVVTVNIFILTSCFS
jgi:hypothetical protein